VRCPPWRSRSARSASTGSATTSSSRRSRTRRSRASPATSPISIAASSTACERQLVREPFRHGDLLQADGPIKIGDIDLGEDGEEIFKQGISLIWKEQVVNRIYDKANDTLIYLAHSRQVQDGSAKMSMTTVPLFGQQVVWKNGKPQ
jgi:hypothetical protein